jgi:PTS system mannose-specific IID component/fructoselysine and glucoselysine-specific PTS system IID component
MFFELGNGALKEEAPGFVTSMVPIIEKVYDSKEDKIEAYKRHTEYYLSEGRAAGLNVGIAAAMEERLALQRDIEPESINAVKSALMGPLAALGDSIIHGTFRPLFAGIACSLVIASGYKSVFGPIMFVVIMTAIGFLVRYYGTFLGYSKGTEIIDAIQNSGLVRNMTHLAGTAAYLLVGGFSVGLVTVKIPWEFKFEETVVSFQSMLDGLCPGLLSMLLIGLMYFLMTKKKISPTFLLFACLALGIIGKYAGFLG